MGGEGGLLSDTRSGRFMRESGWDPFRGLLRVQVTSVNFSVLLV